MLAGPICWEPARERTLVVICATLHVRFNSASEAFLRTLLAATLSILNRFFIILLNHRFRHCAFQLFAEMPLSCSLLYTNTLAFSRHLTSAPNVCKEVRVSLSIILNKSKSSRPSGCRKRIHSLYESSHESCTVQRKIDINVV